MKEGRPAIHLYHKNENNEDDDQYNNINDEMNSDIRESFEVLDTDQDGYLTPREFYCLYTALGYKPERISMEELLSLSGIPLDDNLSLARVVDVLKNFSRDRKVHLEDVFGLLDSDSKGYLTVQDLEYVGQEIDEKINRTQLEWMLNVCCHGNSGNDFADSCKTSSAGMNQQTVTSRVITQDMFIKFWMKSQQLAK